MSLAQEPLVVDTRVSDGAARVVALPYVRNLPLVVILIAGLSVRLWGLSFGLPFDYHVDETPYVAPAWLLRQGVVDPLLTSLSMFVFLEHAVLGLLGGLSSFIGLPVGNLQPNNTVVYTILARTTSALLGSLTVVPLYLLGRRWWGEAAGLLAGLLYSLSFLAVRNAHYGVPDVTGAFFVLLSTYYSTRLGAKGSAKYYALAGLTAGIAIAARPQTVLLLLPAILFHLAPATQTQRARPGTLWRALKSKFSTWRGAVHELRALLLSRNPGLYVGALILAFALSAPAILVHPLEYARMIHNQMQLSQMGGFGRFQVIDSSGWAFYAETLRWGMGDVALALAVIGIIWILLQRRHGQLFLFMFPLMSLVLMGATAHAMARYLLPIYPFLSLAAAIAIVELSSKLVRTRFVGTIAAAVVTGLALFQPMQAIVWHDQLLTRADTRTIARDWIELNLPAGSVIAQEWYTPALSDLRAPDNPRVPRFETRGTSVFGLSEDAHGTQAGVRTLSDYQASGVDYLIASSFSWQTRMLATDEQTRKSEFYATLDADAELVKEFSPFRPGARASTFRFDDIYGPAESEFEMERPGPIIRIYKIQPS